MKVPSNENEIMVDGHRPLGETLVTSCYTVGEVVLYELLCVLHSQHRQIRDRERAASLQSMETQQIKGVTL